MIKISPQKTYYFFFFSTAYAFLSFWISLTYFAKENNFLIGGVLFYLFVIIFHRAIINITNKNQVQVDEMIKNQRLGGFYVRLIIFCILGSVSIYLLQQFLISNVDFPSEIFTRVDWVLNLFSLIISFLLSFSEKSGNSI